MTDLIGVWEFNGNGWPGRLYITEQDEQGNLSVSVKFQDREFEEQLIGVWTEGARQITLTRTLPNNITQTHIGYIGDGRPDLALNFGGSFTESDAGNVQFGWYAKWLDPLIP